MGFFEKLNFSSSNEDGASEIAALGSARRIVCITGSGTRPLDLLHTDASEVIAVDVNPAQNALLALKLAAIEYLEHKDYLTFLGITAGRRAALYRRIRPSLSPAMADHWDRRHRLIEKGVWYAGKWERILAWNARILRLFRGRAIDALMSAPDVETQARIWKERFSDLRLRRAIEMLGRRWVWRFVLREPGGAFLPDPKAVGDRLEARFDRAAREFLFRDSDFATLIFRGALDPQGGLPVHMTPKHYERTQARIGRIRIVEGHLSGLDDAGLSDIDGFSLSDFGSYTDATAYAGCWRGILGASAPGARFCERVFLNDLALPFDALKVDAALSARLTARDRAIIYKLRAGTITKG